ncbi:MAG TPA: hypothetical protein VM097_11370 [Mycobacteriales bacterium]|nr:hypothetical protein [Mycobacteriales bacterium]
MIVLPAGSQPASAINPVQAVNKIVTGGVPHVVFLVQDLGGGAYWVPTTGIHYVVQAGSEILFDGDHTIGDLVAVLQANGRDLLLLINGAILVPVKEAVGG